MSKIKNVLAGLVLAGFLTIGAQPALAASLSPAQTQAILSLLSSFGADSATIASVNAALTGTAVPVVPVAPGVKFGSRGPAVVALQKELIAGGYSIPAGATGYYGAQTLAAFNAREKDRANAAPSTPAVTGNGLKVSLATDSPNNVALVQTQATGELAKFTFSNPTSSDVKVTTLSFKRIGVSTDSALTNVYLFNGATRVTDPAGISQSTFSFNDASGLFVIPAGSTKTISVKADIASGTSGQQIGVQLTAVSSSATTDSTVAFPINSYTQTISSATLASVSFGTVTPSGSEVAPSTDVTIFKTTANVSTRAVSLKALTLENRGSTQDSDFQNVKLFVKGSLVSTGVLSNDRVTFDLSANPIRLETGANEIRVAADVVGGSGESFDFQVRRSADVQFVDVDLNASVSPTGSLSASNDNDIEGVSLSVSKANSSPSSNVAKDGTSIKLGSFEFRAAGDDLKIEQLSVNVDTSVDAGLEQGKIFLNGSQVGSSKNLSEGSNSFTMGSQMVIVRGTTAVVEVYANAKTSAGASFTNGDTVVVGVSVTNSDTQGVKSGDKIASSISTVNANTLTISSSALTLTKFSGYGNQTIIPGANDTLVGSFTLGAGSTEGVNVNTITVKLSSGEAASVTNLVLKDRTTGNQIGSAKSTPGQSNDFSVNVTVPFSSTKTVDIYATIKSNASAGAWTAVASASGSGATTGNTVTAADSDLQVITIGSAVLSAAVNNGSTPESSNVIAGSSEVKVGSFRFTSQYSPYTVQEIKVKVPANSATSVTSVTLKWNGGSATQALALSTGAQTHATATFTGLSFAVPANSDTNLDVYVGIPTIASGATSGAAISVSLDANEGFKAVDASGASDVTLSSSDLDSAAIAGRGTVYVRKTVPVLSAVALDSSVLSAGSNKTIARFKVTSDAAGDISWGRVVFNLSKSSAVDVDSFALYNGSSVVAGTFSTTTTSITFAATNEQQVSGSASYELRASIGGTISTNSYVDVSIANPSTSSFTGTLAGVSTDSSFTWSDRSAVNEIHSTTSSDWTNDHLVKALPITIGNLRQN